jgi:D-3-phosphoglycerate dehydrogenase / 2-oxoglutarate reductase
MILLSHADEERRVFYPDEAVAGLRALDEVRLNTTGAPLSSAAFADFAKGCSIVVGDIEAGADAHFFTAATDLVAYVHGHVDARRVDVAVASANGILVTRASPGFGPGVAELALGFMIDISRGITRSTVEWRSGGSPRTTMSSQLSSMTLGIIGYGHIARHLVLLVRATGMRILVTDPYVQVPPGEGVEQVSFDELLATADFVAPLAVATPKTKNLIDAKALARMKSTAFLINVSRGEIVDEAALKDALDRRIIAGAALDVGLAPGRLPQPWLASRRDVLATPHIGGVTPEAVRHQAMETVRQVAALLRGEVPEGAINPDVATRLRAKR